MIGHDSKEDTDAYGPWPWIVGLALAAAIIGLMFGLASSIS